MKMINEHTPPRTTIKRKHSNLDNSNTSDNGQHKRHATAFSYDKEKHVLETENYRSGVYTNERTDRIYKVNVIKNDKTAINRIGLGKLLTRLRLNNITMCKKVSWNTVCVSFSTREEANRFVMMKKEMEEHGYKTFIPIYYRSVVGVINNVPVELSAKDIFDEITQREDLSQQVLKIERMPRRMKNGHKNYSLNVKVTFSTSELPANVPIYHGLERIHPYIRRVQQCIGGCLRYGHHVHACKSKNTVICSKCGIEGHERNACVATQLSCFHCKGEHEATAKECPERKRQGNINILMGGKNLSYREVLEQYPTLTSKNQFDLLTNINDFPVLRRDSYKNQLTGGKKRFFYLPSRKRQIYSQKKPDVNSQYYSKLTIDTTPTTPITENKHRVTEVEKMTSKITQGMATTSKFANENSICDFFDASISTEENNTKLNEQTEQEDIIKTNTTEINFNSN